MRGDTRLRVIGLGNFLWIYGVLDPWRLRRRKRGCKHISLPVYPLPCKPDSYEELTVPHIPGMT